MEESSPGGTISLIWLMPNLDEGLIDICSMNKWMNECVTE